MPSDKKPIAVRLSDDVRAEVEELAKKYQVSTATVGLWAFSALLEYVKRNKGKVILPLDFDDILKNDSFINATPNITPRINEDTRPLKDFRFPGCMAAGEPAESQLSGETIRVASDLDPATHAVYEVNGQSAEPEFMDGDRWLVELVPEARTARKRTPAVFQDENGCYLKIYNGGKVPFASVNPDFPDVHAGDSLSLVGYPVEKV